jgi:hypothetical protein
MTQKDLFGKDQCISEKKEMETKITPMWCFYVAEFTFCNAPADVWSTLENKLTQMET